MAIVDGQPVNAAYSNAAWVGQEFFRSGASSFATAAGITALLQNTSSFVIFTGSTTQTCKMPDATTLSVYRFFRIANRSTGVVTVYAADGTTLLLTMAGGTQAFFQVTDVSSSNGTWDVDDKSQKATASVSGWLSSSDWSTFNSKGTGTVTSVAMSVPAFLSVAGSPITTTGTLAVTLSGTALPIANGGTSGTTQAAGFDALAPTTTKADLIVRNATTNTRLGVGADGTVLQADSTQATGLKWATPSGSGGGGGGSFQWFASAANSPLESIEFNQKTFNFESGLGQVLYGIVQVPQTYVAGNPIKLYITEYSPSASNTILLTATASLIRAGVDAAGSTTNQRTTTNTALTNSVANRIIRVALDVSSATGTVNGVSVSAGDELEIVLTRGSDTDTADIRLRAFTTEVTFQ